MSEGNRESFCTLLWRSNGGAINAKGCPTNGGTQEITDEELASDEGGERYARGYCTRPYDCLECPLMQQELTFHPPELVNWVCPACLREVSKKAKAKKVKLNIPGHFSEGICTYGGCTRPPRQEQGEALPGIASEQFVTVPAGFSRYRQLVLGPINE